MSDARIEDVLGFWFGAGDDAARQRWFKKDPEFDAAIRERFGALVEAAQDGVLDVWAGEPRGALALVVLLDQFPRNLHRGTEAAFACDDRALRVARAAIAAGHDRALGAIERAMLYMPLMHAEDRALQAESVARYDALAAEAPEADRGYLRTAADFARQHAAIIDRFGRFPHRNALLGRTSTSEEVDFLSQPGSSF